VKEECVVDVSCFLRDSCCNHPGPREHRLTLSATSSFRQQLCGLLVVFLGMVTRVLGAFLVSILGLEQ
jgi:hypothetical protein